MRSMTGFGLARTKLGEGHLQIEVRSVNHRYLDVRVRLPGELVDHGFALEQLARKHLTRGRYDIGVRVEGVVATAPFSFDRARSLYRELGKLRDELAPGTELPVGSLLALPELFAGGADHAEPMREALETTLTRALDALGAMRLDEGSHLARELKDRLALAREHCQALTERAPAAVEASQNRLQERLRRLLQESSTELDPGRLEQEVAILADKADITEELVRLESHFEQFESLLASSEPVGRRLDFLLQEIGREANTIGSKSQDTTLSHRVVSLKAEVERIREQVQNVE